jgi:hypothetical protein
MAIGHPSNMNQIEAFLIALTLLIAATRVARKYLSTDARLVLAIVAAAAHLA